MDIDSSVRSAAHELSDFDLISKLSTGDMIALGANYYSNFLVALYNRARELDKKSRPKEQHQLQHSITLAELICQIQDSRKEQPHTTVFKLSNLKKKIL